MRIWSYEQNSEEWLRARVGRVTASQFSRIITPTGKDSSQWGDYAIELTAQCLRPDEMKRELCGVEFEGNFHTDRGQELEPIARDLFASTMKLDVHKAGFVTPTDNPGCPMGCSPDGLIKDSSGGWIAGLEIKCPLAKHHAKALIAGKMPAEHLPQVHGSMAITGLNYWYYCSYCPGIQPLILREERNDYTAKLEDALARFIEFYRERRREILPILMGK